MSQSRAASLFFCGGWYFRVGRLIEADGCSILTERLVRLEGRAWYA